MTIKWPALRAVCEVHTVDTPRGRTAGFLVRCTSSRRELGYVWQVGDTWCWKVPTGSHYGERSSQRAAVQVLRDAYDLHEHPTNALLPFVDLDDERPTRPTFKPFPLPPMKPRAPRPAPPAPPRPAPKPVEPPPAPPKQIDWNAQGGGDLTNAVLDALRRRPK